MYVKPWIKEIERIGGRQGRQGFLRLDMNENPGGLPETFLEEVKQELTPEYLAMYPEESRMLELLAGFLTAECRGDGADCVITTEQLCLTNGSDMAIRYLYEVFGETGSRVVTVAPSFEMYRIYSLVFGLSHHPVAFDENFELPVERVLEAITEDTDIVVLLNPNNPIGRAWTEDEFTRTADRAEAVGAIVIVDEAYHYFYKQTFLPQALKREHVVVIRTFSKLMSLAGCRMGFLAANPRLVEYVRHVRPSFEVNTVALKFGEKLLERPELVADLIRRADEGKAFLAEGLRARGCEVMEQEGNFLFVRPRSGPAAEVAARLEEKRVLVKTYGASALAPYLRISTGERQYMEAFLQAFDEVEGR